MSLHKLAFSEDHAEKARDFYCGDAPWAQWAAAWICAPKHQIGALWSVERFGNRVWLYCNEDDYLVGFGSLGTTNFLLPDGTSQQVAYIPQMAIQVPFQGKPEGGTRYSDQILGDLILTASDLEKSIIALRVHRDNSAATKLYRRHGFVGPYDSPDDFGNVKMIRRLA